jgi:FtsP/CotA-like multicopper oxidase with cupredoxin domain
VTPLLAPEPLPIAPVLKSRLNAAWERVELILQFTDYIGLFMYHCDLLEHEENGVMGRYQVLR